MARISALAGATVRAAATAALLDQTDAADRHAAIDRLAHVVEGQRRDRDRGERLHLDPGARLHAYPALDGDARRRVIGRELDVDVREREWVAERDQFRRSLRRHDPRQ